MQRLRRITFGQAFVAGLAAVCLTSFVLAQAQKTGRKLGTCGPPPRKNPQRQTSAEGMPPLPLPAVPLRRSEPKAEPAPPLMIAKLEYGTFQDWNTDPGDADNLMRQVRDKLKLWYGWRHININEVVTQHKAGKTLSIPILYMSGHEAFQFNDEQREALRQYVVDGGTFLGDACCGREEFADSFKTEVLKIFPDRAFTLLDVDHPIYQSFYKYSTVNFIEYVEGKKLETKGAPRLLGVNVGCRTAVILTPYDMSCGWDGHTHARGKRLAIEDAQQLGINLVSYVAATRQLGEVQAVTRAIDAPVTRPREQFTFAQLRHDGDWNPDPNSTYQWMRHVALDSSLAVDFKPKVVDAVEAKLAPFPFVYMTGHRDPKLSSRELDAIRRHLQAGGFLFINNCCGRSGFDHHVRAMIAKLFPDQKLATIKPEHPLYKSFFTVKQVRDRQSRAVRAPELEGIVLKGRLVLVYSKNDMVTHLKQVSDPFGNGYDAESCRQLAVNIVAHAMQN
jgi:hypothetical protein